MFSELSTTGLIAAHGPDAASFLHSQLTSDVASLAPLRTQHSAYCSPNGRVLATLLLWRLDDVIVLQLSADLRESIQKRLSKYVLRAKVELADATQAYRLFGVWQGNKGLRDLVTDLPGHPHEVCAAARVFVARQHDDRFLILTHAAEVPRVRAALSRGGVEQPSREWARLDIAAALPAVTAATQEAFIPQMLNLDALGGVSYAKGCYPGQEIVARTRYLGRLKQRLHPVRIASRDVAAGDALYSAMFGPDQASGTVVSAIAEGDDASRAVAVIQLAALREQLHWKSLHGPAVEVEPLPYPLPG